MDSSSTQTPANRSRPIRLLAGIIEALRNTAAVTWASYYKPPGNLYYVLVPVGMLPLATDAHSCEDMHRAQLVWANLLATKSMHFAMYDMEEVFLPAWTTSDGRQRRMWPPPLRVARRGLPRRVLRKFPDIAEQRAIAFFLRHLDTDMLRKASRPDPELTDRIVTFTERIAAYVSTDGVTIRSPFDSGPPFTAWAVDVHHTEKTRSRYWVDGRGWPRPVTPPAT